MKLKDTDLLEIAAQASVAQVVTPQATNQCRTLVLPENPTSREGFPTFSIPPGRHAVLRYEPPVGAASVGLEFWSHWIGNAQTPDATVQITWYIERPGDGPVTSRVLTMGMDWNRRMVEVKNFPMSTFVHPGEVFWVAINNDNEFNVPYFLAVTIRECLPA